MPRWLCYLLVSGGTWGSYLRVPLFIHMENVGSKSIKFMELFQVLKEIKALVQSVIHSKNSINDAYCYFYYNYHD